MVNNKIIVISYEGGELPDAYVKQIVNCVNVFAQDGKIQVKSYDQDDMMDLFAKTSCTNNTVVDKLERIYNKLFVIEPKKEEDTAGANHAACFIGTVYHEYLVRKDYTAFSIALSFALADALRNGRNEELLNAVEILTEHTPSATACRKYLITQSVLNIIKIAYNKTHVSN